MSTYAQNQSSQLKNTNRWSTKQLVTMALMCAIAILLSFLEFPIFPAASFLKLDISFVPSAVMGFAYGTGPGILVGIACAVAHGAITGNWVGCLMNIIACCAFIIPAAAIYKRNRTFKGAMIGLVVAIVCLVIAAIIANLIVDPAFYGIPFDVVAGLIVPAILPFNIIKGIVIAALTGIVVQEHLEPDYACKKTRYRAGKSKVGQGCEPSGGSLGPLRKARNAASPCP